MSNARIVTIDTSITPPSPIFFNEKYTITPIPAKTLINPNIPVPVEVNMSGKIRRTNTVYGNASKNLFTDIDNWEILYRNTSYSKRTNNHKYIWRVWMQYIYKYVFA